MRVLHVTPYFPPADCYGGPPVSILGLCAALQQAGADVEVVTTTANGERSLRPSPAGGEVFAGIPVRYAARAFPRRFFGAHVRGPLTEALGRADLCHIHGVWNVPEWWASHLARERGIPYVVSPRGMLQPEGLRHGRWRKAAAYRLLERKTLRRAARLIASSPQEAEAIAGLDLGVPIATIPNGVDLEAARSASRGFRARLNIPADAFVVLFLGRLHRVKRLDLLADAFAEVHATDPAVHLVIAGPDEQGLAPELKQRLSAHAPLVHMPGALTGADKWALISDADVMVQCSDFESFGLAVAESLAAGVPVIATRTVPWSVVEARGCGLWVEQTAPAIAAAIRALVHDPARRATMGERAASLARDEFGWDGIAATMGSLYAEALATGR